jgi:ceramide glucosyltransferase
MADLLFRTILAAVTLCGVVYWLLTILCIRKFAARNRAMARGNAGPVSILKPLCGLDPHAYENLRSHCLQDYPDFEIIFGVKDPEDPIVPTVERLMREFPKIPMRLVVCRKVLGMNFKVSNLIQMLAQAKHPTIVINDSDIRVPLDYLQCVAGPLRDSTVGLVTCLYRGIASTSIGSRLESLAIESDFIPGVVFASQLEGGVHFALGSTLAVRRDVLDAIGGLPAIVDYLADDYELGYRISKQGFKVVIADSVVDHQLPDHSIGGFFQHQLRWGRTVRSARPGGYAGYVFTFSIPWSLAAVLVFRGSPAGWALIAAALLIRTVATLAHRHVVLRRPRASENIWLLPIRDCVAMVVWAACYAGRRVVWRGNTFELSHGKLRPLEARSMTARLS